MTKKDIFNAYACISAIAAGVPIDAGRLVSDFVEANKRNGGSGRTTKCKKCGATGSVAMGPDGKRCIIGCNCK